MNTGKRDTQQNIMSVNKKIKNATEVQDSGIKFKSKLEKRVYDILIENGFSPQYEPKTHCMVEPFELEIPVYVKKTKSQLIKEPVGKLVNKLGSKVRGITYTPDFYFTHKGYDIYIEVKGFENDVYYLKKKLFLWHIQKENKKSVFCEVHTLLHLEEVISYLNEL